MTNSNNLFKRTVDPEIDPNKYRFLIFDEGATARERVVFSTNGAEVIKHL